MGALGVRFDSTTGLHYMRNRWYDPGLGRFLSRDPLYSENLYSYASNNPVQRIDPLGLDDFDDPEEPNPNDRFPTEEEWEIIEQRVRENYAEEFHSYLDEGCLSSCIEKNRWKWPIVGDAGSYYHIANFGLNSTPMGKRPRAGIGGAGKFPRGGAVSWQHRLGFEYQRRFGFKGPGVYISRVTRFIGRGSVVTTVWEGFYDIGTIGNCVAECMKTIKKKKCKP